MKRGAFFTRWIGSMIALIVAVTWLHRLGQGDLAAPPWSIDGLREWLDHRETIVAAFALVRLVALGFGVYLLALSVCGGAARCFAFERMATFVDRLTLPFARGLLGGMALLGVMASPPQLQPRGPDAMVELPPESDSTTSTVAPDTAVLHDTSAPTEAHATLQLLPEAPALTAPVSASPNDDTWVVQHGESLWSIATEHLADAIGHEVGEREVAPYWRRVVEVNRPNLVNPHDADLLFAGQVIALPAVVSG
ncbi:MAG: resuscitation-promoting factor RpfA [Acidimicrobiaceae bacterium]|jgi:LysM repeat protein